MTIEHIKAELERRKADGSAVSHTWGVVIPMLLAELEAAAADKARLDWLEAHPLQSEIQGGSGDGSTGRFWGCGSAELSLRATIDTIREATGAV